MHRVRKSVTLAYIVQSDWGVVYLLAAPQPPQVQLSVSNAWAVDGHVMYCGTIGLSHFRDIAQMLYLSMSVM